MTALQATAVAFGGRAALLTGPSGSGKSGHALQLLAMGAQLVADDGVLLSVAEGTLWAEAPSPTRGMIEARGVGLLWAEVVPRAPVALVIDLGRPETERLPPFRTTTLLGVTLPLLHKVDSPYFAAAIRQYLAAGRSA